MGKTSKAFGVFLGATPAPKSSFLATSQILVGSNGTRTNETRWTKTSLGIQEMMHNISHSRRHTLHHKRIANDSDGFQD